MSELSVTLTDSSSALASIASIGASSQTILFYAAGATVFAGGATMVYRNFYYLLRIEKAAEAAKQAAQGAERAAEAAQKTSEKSVQILKKIEPDVAEVKQEVGNLRQNVSELGENVAKVSENVGSIDAKLDHLSNVISTNQEAVVSAQNDIIEKLEEVGASNTAVLASQKSMEKSMVAAQSEISNKLETLIDENSAISVKLDAVAQSNSAILVTQESMVSAQNEISHKLDTMTSENSAINAKLDGVAENNSEILAQTTSLLESATQQSQFAALLQDSMARMELSMKLSRIENALINENHANCINSIVNALNSLSAKSSVLLNASYMQTQVNQSIKQLFSKITATSAIDLNFLTETRVFVTELAKLITGAGIPLDDNLMEQFFERLTTHSASCANPSRQFTIDTDLSDGFPEAPRHQVSPLVSPVAPVQPARIVTLDERAFYNEHQQDGERVDGLVHGVPFGTQNSPSKSIALPSDLSGNPDDAL